MTIFRPLRFSHTRTQLRRHAPSSHTGTSRTITIMAPLLASCRALQYLHHAHGNAPQPLSKGEAPYAFPVARALRHVRFGRHFYRRHDGVQEMEALLARCGNVGSSKSSHELLTTDTVVEDSTQLLLDEDHHALAGEAEAGSIFIHTHDRAPDGWAENEREVPHALEAPKLDEMRRFANYHCHHVKVAYKRDRAAWTAKLQRKQQQQRSAQDASHRHSYSQLSPSPPPPLLSTRDVSTVTSYLFQASLLLHLTALYGVGEQYLEDLLEICLSGSIFLSQQHNASRHQCQPSHQHRPISVTSSRPFTALPLGSGRGSRALYWTVVHYAEGVRLWGLLDHTKPLFPILTRHGPRGADVADAAAVPCGAFGKLLQTHAGLLRRLTVTAVAANVDSATLGTKRGGSNRDASTRGAGRRDLQALLAGAASQQRSGAIAQWFHGCLDRDRADGGDHPFTGWERSDRRQHTQQRCLQLLPHLWLSMLANHISLDGGQSKNSSRSMSGSDTQSSQCSQGPPMPLVREAFRQTIALFSTTAPPNATFWALAGALYSGSACDGTAGGGTPASASEVAAMLAGMERADLLPIDAFARMDSRGDAARRWLAHWRAASEAQRDPLLMTGTTTALAIRSPTDLYAALVNIPLFLCPLPRKRLQERQGSQHSTALADNDIVSAYLLSRGGDMAATASTRKAAIAANVVAAEDRQTADDLRFVNALLFRALLQWRAARLCDIVSSSARTLNAASTLKDDESLARNESVKHAELLREQRSAADRRLWTCTAYLEELALVLEAASHLRALHGRADTLAQETRDETVAGRTTETVSSAAAVVAQTTEAAMRALAGQLAGGILPRRQQQTSTFHNHGGCGGGGYFDRHATTRRERELLSAIDVAVTGVLGCRNDVGGGHNLAEAAAAPLAGSTPRGYHECLHALLQG